MKTLLSIFVFIPALLICCISKESLQEGIYNKSFGTIATFVIMGAAVNYLIHFSKVKDGWQFWAWVLIIVGIGLSIATLF
jgi:undecaprenyl pyrophosphate phosphatase UppP